MATSRLMCCSFVCFVMGLGLHCLDENCASSSRPVVVNLDGCCGDDSKNITYKHTLRAVITILMPVETFVLSSVSSKSSLLTFGGDCLDVDKGVLSKSVSEKAGNT